MKSVTTNRTNTYKRCPTCRSIFTPTLNRIDRKPIAPIQCEIDSSKNLFNPVIFFLKKNIQIIDYLTQTILHVQFCSKYPFCFLSKFGNECRPRWGEKSRKKTRNDAMAHVCAQFYVVKKRTKSDQDTRRGSNFVCVFGG